MGLLNAFAQVDYTYTTVDTTNAAGVAIFSGIWLLIWLVVLVLVVAGMWKIFAKAGEAGWQALVPIWNVVVFLKIIGRPVWWILLFFIPFVNLVVAIVVAIDLGKAFNKDAVYSFFLLFLFSAIGYVVLGFGDAEYKGPLASGGNKPAAPAEA